MKNPSSFWWKAWKCYMNERSRWMYGWNWDFRKIDIIKRSGAKQQFRVIHSNSILKPFNSVEFHLLNLECLSTRANIFSLDSIYFEIYIDSHCWRHIISNVNSTILMCFLETSVYTLTYYVINSLGCRLNYCKENSHVRLHRVNFGANDEMMNYLHRIQL